MLKLQLISNSTDRDWRILITKAQYFLALVIAVRARDLCFLNNKLKVIGSEYIWYKHVCNVWRQIFPYTACCPLIG